MNIRSKICLNLGQLILSNIELTDELEQANASIDKMKKQLLKLSEDLADLSKIEDSVDTAD